MRSGGQSLMLLIVNADQREKGHYLPPPREDEMGQPNLNPSAGDAPARNSESHARRDELTPCFERHRSPRLLDAYRLLPGGNCKRCGKPTCLALAALLVFGEARISDCPRLSEPELARDRKALLEWLGIEGWRTLAAPVQGVRSHQQVCE